MSLQNNGVLRRESSLPVQRRNLSRGTSDPRRPDVLKNRQSSLWRAQSVNASHSVHLEHPAINSIPNEQTPLIDQEPNEICRSCYRIFCYAPVGFCKSVVTWCFENTFYLGLCLVGMVLTSGEIIFRKVIAQNMFHYRWFLIQIISLGTTIVFAIQTFRTRHATRGFRVHLTSSIRSDTEDSTVSELGHSMVKTYVPIRQCLVMAGLDTIHTFLVFIPIGILPGPVSAVLPLCCFSLTIFLEAFTCEVDLPTTFYRWWHFVGVILLLVSIFLISIWGYDWQDQLNTTQATCAIVLVSLSALPLALSNIYKRSVLHRHQHRVAPFNAQLSFLQFIFGFILAPVALRIQYITSEGSWGLTEIFPNFIDGFLCLFGKNSNSSDVCDQISYLLLTDVLLYLFFLTSSLMLSYHLLQIPEVSAIGVNMVFGLGTLLAFALFYSDAIISLYRESEDFVTFDPSGVNVWTMIGVLVGILGYILANNFEDESTFDIDDPKIWFQAENDLADDTMPEWS